MEKDNLSNKETDILGQVRFTPLTWSEIDKIFQIKYKTKANSSTHHIKSLQNKGFIVKINDRYKMTYSGHDIFIENLIKLKVKNLKERKAKIILENNFIEKEIEKEIRKYEEAI